MSEVGGYQLLESIGRGALGEAFRARDTVHGRTVVVKRVPAELASDEAWLAHLNDTGIAVAAVSHPGVAMLYECGVHEGETFLAQEFVPGQSLAQVLAGRPIHPRRALDIAVDIADGLAAIHAAGLTHGDLRPATAMVTPKGHVKLLDAGLSAFTHGGHIRRLAASDPDFIPASGTGVVRYLSPEQALGEKGDARSDLFALGLLLYEMLTGQAAFDRATPGETALAIVRDQPGRPSARQPNVPPEIDAIVARLLAKPVERRYQSASAVSDALRAIKPLFEEEPDELEALANASPGGRSRILWWALLAAAGAGAVTWLLLRSGS
jgi:serine/threonine protein kinase